jgi:osmotically-inducible protein OsmY
MNQMKTRLALGCIAACLCAAAWAAGTPGSDDSALTTRVKSALMANPDPGARQIEVDSANGVVTLSGSVDNESAKISAESAARGVAGVSSVDNKLMVKDAGSNMEHGSSSAPGADERTSLSHGTSNAASALGAEATSLSSSTLASPAAGSSMPASPGLQRDPDERVVAAAGPSTGGSSTTSGNYGLGTSSTGRAHSGDTTVAQADSDSQIMQALKADTRTSKLQIDVKSGSQGTVVLSGTVATAAERDEAAEVARGVSGVSKVDNKITVKSANKSAPY